MKEDIQVYEQLGLRDYTQDQIGLDEKPSYILPTEWGYIYGDIMNQRDLISLIDAGAHSEDKEVIGVLTYADTAPEDADEGDMYINSDENILYGLHSGQWAEADASTDVLYITADTSHIYIYNGTAFSDATGGVVDNTIYVSNITTGLESFTDPGLYTVCVARAGLSTQWYTMAVLVSRKLLRHRGVVIYRKQLLKNEKGYWERNKTGDGVWSEWSEFIYASEKYVRDSIMEEVTHAELVALRDNGELVPGKRYRITDFVTTTRSHYYNEDETEYRSAGHAFDLIVTADSSTTLNKMAKATPHTGDTYFADADLSRWRIMYDLNNDQTRYDWADPENGKGVIYDMIDEWENHCRYDFKNIQYKRYKVTAVSKAALNDLIGTYALSSQGLTLDNDDYIWAYTFNVYGFTYNRDDENEDISVETDYQNSEDRSLNKREYLRAYASYNDGEDYASDYNNSICHDNDIPAYYSMEEDLMDGENCYWRGYQQLNNIVFLHSAPDYDYSYDSGQLLYLLFYYTEPAYGNKFGVNCYCNTFGNNVYRNTFGNDFRYNTFGNYVYYNTFGNNVWYNTFGNGVQYFKYGTAGTTYDYMYYCYVESGVQNVYCYPQTTPTSSSMFQNVHIHSGLKGSSNTNRLILNNFSTNKDYVQHAEKDASGNYLIHWLGNYLTATGYYKNSITGTTWTTIPA